MWRGQRSAIHAGGAYRRPEFRLTRARAPGVYGCPASLCSAAKDRGPFHVSPVCGHRGGNARGQRSWRNAFHRRLQGPDARQHRRRLRRHRHQPALRVARSGGCRQRNRDHCDAAGRARRALADPVGADRGGDAQICPHPAARRQQRRGRNAGADGAGATRGEQGRRRDRAARHHLWRAFLRRRGPYTGAVGAVGDRRHQARHRDLRTLCRAADADHPGGAVRRAVPRHRARRRVLRTGHVRLVRRHCDRGRAADIARIPKCCWRSIRSTPFPSCSITA